MRRLLLAAVLLAAAGPTATPAAAQTLADYDYENLTFRGVGLDAGYMWPSKVEDTRTYGVRLDLGYLGPGVRIIPSLSYWSSEFTAEELEVLAQRINDSGGAVDAETLGPLKWSDLSLALDGQFVWNTPLQVLTFVGGGVGLHALNGQGEAVDDTFVEDLLDSVTAGVNAMAGAEFEPLPRFRIYGEGRYTALNSMQWVSVKVGGQFMFSVDERATVGHVAPVPDATGPALAEAPRP
ncbi:MAG TPA: hypothetical protein VK966_04245 [Longimicrobiales bacterium]|nr:hypothetical protein [Longimicrobiales bacterium]